MEGRKPSWVVIASCAMKLWIRLCELMRRRRKRSRWREISRLQRRWEMKSMRVRSGGFRSDFLLTRICTSVPAIYYWIIRLMWMFVFGEWFDVVATAVYHPGREDDGVREIGGYWYIAWRYFCFWCIMACLFDYGLGFGGEQGLMSGGFLFACFGLLCWITKIGTNSGIGGS